MSGMAKISIIGNVGSDPQIKVLDGGNSVTTFSVAVSPRKDAEPDWYRVSAWGKLGEVCSSYVTKGMRIYVDGRFSVRPYEKDGAAKFSLEINATDVQFMEAKDRGQGPAVRSYHADDAVPF